MKMSKDEPTVAHVPCGSCPYRRDAPSGLWERHEYEKLPDYDNPTANQPLGLFMCHQRDGNLCAGWLACHNQAPHDHALLALRLWGCGPEIQGYKTSVPVFLSGAEAFAHGVRDIKHPDDKACKMMVGLLKARKAR
jgi:Family of unknown function (DUF6283)